MSGVEEIVRYSYRLRPGAVAERALLEEWHRCRFLWNEAVHQQKSGNKPTFCTLSKLLTAARGRSAWLRAGSQVAQQQTLRTYAAALNHSYTVTGRGKPVFKARKKTRPSLEYTSRGFSVRDGRLRLPGGVSVPVVWSRELPSAPTSVRVYRDSLGHWYASFVVRRDRPAGTGRGRLDRDRLGCQHHRHHYRPGLRPALRRAAAPVRRGAGAGPAEDVAPSPPPRARPVGRVPAGPAGGRAAAQDGPSGRTPTPPGCGPRRSSTTHQTIAVEDFRPQFLSRSTMARKAADAAIGTAKREVIERGVRAGRKVVLVPPAYTTMTCSECLARAKQPLGLAERIFRCEHCGYTADRDRNAARTILATVEPDRAGADDVRHRLPPPGDASSAVRVRNPPASTAGKG